MGCVHNCTGPIYSHVIYLQLYIYTKAEGIHDLHIVIPQLELLLPNPSVAHSPKIDYFATNYLQMWNHFECYENREWILEWAEDRVDNIAKSLLCST